MSHQCSCGRDLNNNYVGYTNAYSNSSSGLDRDAAAITTGPKSASMSTRSMSSAGAQTQLTAKVMFGTVGSIKALREKEKSSHVATRAELPKPLNVWNPDEETIDLERNGRTKRPTLVDIALQVSAQEGLNAMTELYGVIEPNIVKHGQILNDNHPAALLSKFSAPVGDTEAREMAAFATISATKAFRKNYKYINDLGRQAHTHKISLKKTALEGLCPARDPPQCMPASERYRTHDGTCNNRRRPRWGASQMPFNRFLPPEYGDGVDSIRESVEGGPLSSSRFVSLLVHGARDGDAPLTLMVAQWGQLLDHDLTSTAQPRSINGSVPSCCGGTDFHPSCYPIKVPLDDPWLAPLKVRCLEFLRSAPAQRRDCILSWREQTNQATSYIDASPIYSNSARSSDNARIFRNGLLIYGKGNPAQDVCRQGALASHCIRSGDGRSGEQPGLLAMHHVWVSEHNRIASDLSELNLHWSDEKIYQETRRIIAAMFQHITFREFLPVVLGREVVRLFDLELLNSGYYQGYDHRVNPTVANAFAAAAFRFGHSLVQNSYMRCDRHHNIINNNVSLHEEFQKGDIGSAGSLHRLLRGMALQRALKRDEFITPELTNHLFQTPGFPFGLDLAAINIQRGRDHGIAPYTSWRVPCGLTPINTWDDFANVVGPESAKRIGHAYRSVHDIDLFVGGISERPVIGGLVGPTFACVIAQQFSNSRKGDRFWYENGGFESSFTPAQLQSLRRVSFAQILCRTVGGGTFQPHIFIPPEFPGNERQTCGVGPLSPIDLRPWLEQDPFSLVESDEPTIDIHSEKEFEILEAAASNNLPIILNVKQEDFSNRLKPNRHPGFSPPHVTFTPNSSIGFHLPQKPSKINDKLDIRRKSSTTKRPQNQKVSSGVSNKLDQVTKLSLNVKNTNRRKFQTTTKRTVVINNVPVQLRNVVEEKPNPDLKKKTQTQEEPMNKFQNTVELLKQHDNVMNSLEGKFNEQFKGLDEDLERNNTSQIEEEEKITDERHPENRADNKVLLNHNSWKTLTVTDENLESRESIPEEVNGEPDLHTLENINVTNEGLSLEKNFNENNSADLSQEVLIEIEKSAASLVEQLKNDLNPIFHSETLEHKRFQRKLEPSANITKTKSNHLRLKHPSEKVLHSNLTTKFILSNIKKRASTTPATFFKNFSTTKNPKRTENTLELRQYQPYYTKPQKVVLNGPNSDQYEIEINIRQTNKSPTYNSISPNAEYTTVYKPYGTNTILPFSSSTPSYNYHQGPPSSFLANLQSQNTRPPTIIYVDENEEMTTKAPGFLQNILSFATNGFSNTRKPQSNKDRPEALTSAIFPNSRPQYPLAASAVSHFGENGIVHSSSATISNGPFAAIAGITSANGADSIFSFNIRPKPNPASSHIPNSSILPNSHPVTSYGPFPPGYNPNLPQINQETFSGLNAPIQMHNNYFPSQPSDSPFSSGHPKPQNFLTHFNGPQRKDISDRAHHKLDAPDYDFISRTVNQKPDSDKLLKIEYNYSDESNEDIPSSSKFDRDGYLRPEHMVANLYRNSNSTTSSKSSTSKVKIDDNFVSSALNETKILMSQQNKSNSIEKNFTEFIQDFGNNKDLPIQTTKTNARNNKRQSYIALAPLTILTAIERPDKWVTVDEVEEEMPLLPALPNITVGNDYHSKEIPIPFNGANNIWLKKYIQDKFTFPSAFHKEQNQVTEAQLNKVVKQSDSTMERESNLKATIDKIIEMQMKSTTMSPPDKLPKDDM